MFGELFAHQIPSGFKAQTEQTRGGVYARTIVLATDPDAGPWTQRVLVTANKDLGKQPDVTAKAVAMRIAQGFQQSCPTTFVGTSVADSRIETGQPVHVVLVGCGSHNLTTARTATSEIALVAVVKGAQNVYSVQWSERAAPQAAAPKLDPTIWGDRLKALNPLLVCEQKPNESAPYPSCRSNY